MIKPINLTLSLGNTTLYYPREAEAGRGGTAGRGRRGQWQRWRQGGENETHRWQSLRPSGGLPEQGMINERERERETMTEREREADRYQLYLCGLILSCSAWWRLQVPCSLTCHASILTHTHTHSLSTKKKKNHSTQTHTCTQHSNTVETFTSCFVTLEASLPSGPSGDCREWNKERRDCKHCSRTGLVLKDTTHFGLNNSEFWFLAVLILRHQTMEQLIFPQTPSTFLTPLRKIVFNI